MPSPTIDTARAVTAAAKALAGPFHLHPHPEPAPHQHFITISRQAGTGAMDLAHQLCDKLNSEHNPAVPWTAWDRELVEKVAVDHNITPRLIEVMEDEGHSWLEELFAGLSLSDRTCSQFKVYRSVATTLRSLAQHGHVVLVGRGGVFITNDMPGGIHLRLIAPLNWRIDNLARSMGLSKLAATAEVRHLDAARAAFYDRYWPSKPFNDELFNLIINTARNEESLVVRCVTGLVPRRPAVPDDIALPA